MVGILRSLGTGSVIPAAIAAVALLSSPSSSRSPTKPYSFFSPSSLNLASSPKTAVALRTKSRPPAALSMSSPATELTAVEQQIGILPDLLTEFMVDMKCEGCVSAVKNNMLKLDGVKSIDVDLNNQVVRVLGSLPVKTMADALEQTGRKARLIGQGNPEDFLVSAAVSEFKGPVIFGVVRLAQVSMELVRIEANFSGLSPGKHGWAIHEFGDLTKGAASTGNVFNPANSLPEKPVGDLGTLEATENGEAEFSGGKAALRVADLIGRSIVVYESKDTTTVPGITAAVIARSAGVGENYKKICTCDGVTIWESG